MRTAPSVLTTRFGAGVGSPRKAVLAAHGKLRDPAAGGPGAGTATSGSGSRWPTTTVA